MDLDEIWYGGYAHVDSPKTALSNFTQSVILTWWANKPVRWD
jgi:hypothetical protein